MTEFSELKNYCFRLYLNFLKPYIHTKTLLPSSGEEDSVKAFCVLSHAAIEEYFEKITLNTISNSYKVYKSSVFIDKIPISQNDVDGLNRNTPTYQNVNSK